jgi:hypothetical protein
MAPEVAQVMPYGLSADVYSFGILMWEMLTLKAAFEGYTREKHYKEVVVEGKRPKLSKSWPFVVQNFIDRCWDEKPLKRPTFQAVCELIKIDLPGDQVDRSIRRSYRSTYGPGKISGNSIEGDKVVESDSPSHSDSLSVSIRIKVGTKSPYAGKSEGGSMS